MLHARLGCAGVIYAARLGGGKAPGAGASKTLRAVRVRQDNAPASWSAAALRRFGPDLTFRTRTP